MLYAIDLMSLNIASYPSSPNVTSTTQTRQRLATTSPKTGNSLRIVNINVNSIKSTKKKVLF